MPKTLISVAEGDGIGPEIMQATRWILDEAAAPLEYESIQVGRDVYLKGFSSGIEPGAWDSLRRTRVLLKGPITTPQGGGYKSLNVTIRKTLGLYANVRPCASYHPFIHTRHPDMDVVIVRENEEDLYAGIEHQQTDQVVQCLKLISRPGSERVIRYAYEFARRNNRRKISVFIKDNIMKLSDGLFHRVFQEIGEQYPDIQQDSWIVDIGAARLADTPEIFDVIVMPNLYGDILSDVAAQITGSVGLGGSANIGTHCAMFEAIHGSAPPLAGLNLANPSGLLLSAVMLLVHVNEPDVASRVHNAWLRTIEDGIHTADIFKEGVSRERAGTREFARAVIERLGQLPQTLRPVNYAEVPPPALVDAVVTPRPRSRKELVGVDVFLDWNGYDIEALAADLKRLEGDALELALITNRGVKVWPGGAPETFRTDHWRCRFRAKPPDHPVAHQAIVELLGRLAAAGFDFIKTENLCNFDGRPGYSLGQGE